MPSLVIFHFHRNYLSQNRQFLCYDQNQATGSQVSNPGALYPTYEGIQSRKLAVKRILLLHVPQFTPIQLCN